jgi:hypothetical protein
MKDVDGMLSEMPRLGDECSLRFVLVPTRDEEAIDPVTLDSAEFRSRLMEIGHRADVGLFSYEMGKSTEASVASIVINQDDERRRGWVDLARLEVTSKSIITIDANVTRRVQAEDIYSMQSYHEIVEEDIFGRIRACFSFCRHYWELTDPYIRYQQFVFNAALNNIGHRRIVNDRKPRHSFSVGFAEQQQVEAFTEARNCNRQGLAEPRDHINTVMVMFRRRLAAPV